MKSFTFPPMLLMQRADATLQREETRPASRFGLMARRHHKGKIRSRIARTLVPGAAAIARS